MRVWQSRSYQTMCHVWSGHSIFTLRDSARRSRAGEAAGNSLCPREQSVYPGDLSGKKVAISNLSELAGSDRFNHATMMSSRSYITQNRDSFRRQLDCSGVNSPIEQFVHWLW